MTVHTEILLPPFPRGFHLVTQTIMEQLPELPEYGLLHLLIMHTSAGLTVNENADPSVREDFAAFFNRLVPENTKLFTHTSEGPDDMPAHIQSSLTGHTVTLPIVNGKPGLGTWQGIYLCEFRRHGGRRRISVTIIS
ncbi:MAG: YjbQ family protein [Bacteroidales bacterium]|nr:YjbQ family protein [Bacteroidales bacterium]